MTGFAIAATRRTSSTLGASVGFAFDPTAIAFHARRPDALAALLRAWFPHASAPVSRRIRTPHRLRTQDLRQI
jgi:hypothetical protein